MKTLHAKQLIEQRGIDYFKAGSTFGALSEEAIRFLLENGKVIQLDEGDTLFEFGDPGDSFFVILQGRIRFTKPRRKDVTHIRDYTFGQEVGCVAMIGLHDRVGSTHAVEDSIVIEVPCAVFHSLQLNLPTDFGVLLLNLSRELSRRLRESDNKLAEHAIQPDQ